MLVDQRRNRVAPAPTHASQTIDNGDNRTSVRVSEPSPCPTGAHAGRDSCDGHGSQQARLENGPGKPARLTLVAGVTEDTILDQIGLLSHLRCAAHHIGFGSMGPDAAAHEAAADKAAAHEAGAWGGALAHVAA